MNIKGIFCSHLYIRDPLCKTFGHKLRLAHNHLNIRAIQQHKMKFITQSINPDAMLKFPFKFFRSLTRGIICSRFQGIKQVLDLYECPTLVRIRDRVRVFLLCPNFTHFHSLTLSNVFC